MKKIVFFLCCLCAANFSLTKCASIDNNIKKYKSYEVLKNDYVGNNTREEIAFCNSCDTVRYGECEELTKNDTFLKKYIANIYTLYDRSRESYDSYLIGNNYNNIPSDYGVYHMSHDDEIVNIIPKNYFKECGNYSYVGKEFGFYINTSSNNFPSKNSNISEVIIFDVENRLPNLYYIETEDKCYVDITPIYQSKYIYNRQTNNVSRLKNDTDFRYVLSNINVSMCLMNDTMKSREFHYDGQIFPLLNQGDAGYDSTKYNLSVSSTPQTYAYFDPGMYFSCFGFEFRNTAPYNKVLYENLILGKYSFNIASSLMSKYLNSSIIKYAGKAATFFSNQIIDINDKKIEIETETFSPKRVYNTRLFEGSQWFMKQYADNYVKYGYSARNIETNYKPNNDSLPIIYEVKMNDCETEKQHFKLLYQVGFDRKIYVPSIMATNVSLEIMQVSSNGEYRKVDSVDGWWMDNLSWNNSEIELMVGESSLYTYEKEKSCIVNFTPEYDGNYSFETFDTEDDTYIKFFDENNKFVNDYDDGGAYVNSKGLRVCTKFDVNLKGGNTYSLEIREYDDFDDFIYSPGRGKIKVSIGEKIDYAYESKYYIHKNSFSITNNPCIKKFIPSRTDLFTFSTLNNTDAIIKIYDVDYHLISDSKYIGDNNLSVVLEKDNIYYVSVQIENNTVEKNIDLVIYKEYKIFDNCEFEGGLDNTSTISLCSGSSIYINREAAYILVEPQSTIRLTFETKYISGEYKDITMQILDGNFNKINNMYNDDGAGNLQPRITMTFEGGKKYYLHIKQYSITTNKLTVFALRYYKG